MLNEYVFDKSLTWFGLLNIGLALGATALLVTFFVRKRYLCIKPGVVLLLYSHLFMQWPFALYAPYYAEWLPLVADFCFLIHGFVYVGILVESLSYTKISAKAFDVICLVKKASVPPQIKAWMVSTAVAGFFLTSIYLLYVPIGCTGLVALVVDPLSVPIMRELTFKLLADALPRYAYALLSSSVLPVLLALCLIATVYGVKERRWNLVCLAVVFATFVTVAASLTATKGNLVKLGLVCGVLVFWREQASLRSRALILYMVIGIGSLVPALLVSILFAVSGHVPITRLPHECLAKLNNVPLSTEFTRSIIDLSSNYVEDNSSASNYVEDNSSASNYVVSSATVFAQVKAVLYRAFVSPMEVGGWYIHYAQTNGKIGIGGIPKLARLFAFPAVDAPNLIGKTYGPRYYGHHVLDSISAGGGFLFTYYLYFGMGALPIALMLLILIDAVVYIYARLPSALSLALVSALTVQVMMFFHADITVVFLTHGILPTILLVAGLAAFTEKFA